MCICQQKKIDELEADNLLLYEEVVKLQEYKTDHKMVWGIFKIAGVLLLATGMELFMFATIKNTSVFSELLKLFK